MRNEGCHVVTGAYGYSGKCIALRLLAAGREVRTLTNSVRRRNAFGDRVKPSPFHFDAPPRLREALRGADVLYNTYWVRFSHDDFTFAEAIANSRTLFDAAARAGVRRIVHVSITNPSEDSPLEYFRGKAVVERALAECGVPHTILRPAVLFGREDILINNIAWMLRVLPVLGIFGDGTYRLQPIHVDDLAELAVRGGTETERARVVDAIGPETFTYRELVRMIGRTIGHPRPMMRVPDWLGYASAWALGKVVNDVVLTREEIEGLKAGLLCTDSAPAGRIRLSEWVRAHRHTLGRYYASELARRRNRSRAYDRL